MILLLTQTILSIQTFIMLLISHRGNFKGPNPKDENTPEYILNVINMGYDCEIDIWLKDQQLYLGHDSNETKIELDFLRNSKLWCHAKDIECLNFLLKNDIHCFWHEEDLATITSHKWIWCHPRCLWGGEKSIIVKPEINNIDINNFEGICSDQVYKYKK